MKIVSRRIIQELSDPENAKSTHIMQVTPSIFAIGSIIKNAHNNLAEKPYLHVIEGDLSDPETNLKINAWELISSIKKFYHNKPTVLRSFYLKER